MLVAVVRFTALEQGVDRHCVTMPKLKVLLEPGHDVARFDARLDVLPIGKAFFCGELAEVRRAFARLGLDILEVGLK